jgi:hypothetical protein
MARRARSTEELIADSFADLSMAQQEQMLLVLQSIHRQQARADKRAKPALADTAMLPLRETT